MSSMPRAQRKIPKLKAKNPFNQTAIDHLYTLSQTPRYATSDHYPRLFYKGMSSLSKCPLKIESFKDATSLQGVGNFLAREIMSVVDPHPETGNRNMEDGSMSTAKKGRNQKKTAAIPSKPTKLKSKTTTTTTTSTKSMSKSKAPITATATATATAMDSNNVNPLANVGRKRKSNKTNDISDTILRPSSNESLANPSIESTLISTTTSRRGTNRDDIHVNHPISKTSTRKFTTNKTVYTESMKEKSHISSTNESIGILTNIKLYCKWKIILLLDCREHHSNAVQSKLLQHGIDCEQRQLPIGDILWIARGEYQPPNNVNSNPPHGSHDNNNNNSPMLLLPKQIELVLGTIIERKSLSDLVSSLYGTRFEEQRLRLKHSHSAMDCANQVIFLVEGNQLNDISNCPAATLKYAMMCTRIHMGFQVIRTKDLDDTCRMLQRIHYRIMTRTFTEEMKYSRMSAFCSSSYTSSPNVSKSPKNNNNKHKRKRKKKNLYGPDVFHSTPNIPFERTRHYSYNELKTKIEFDRERGTKSVHAIFRAQLKQVESMSIKKVDAISKVYKTPRELMKSYEQLFSQKSCETMVQDITLGTRISRVSRVGPKSSLELSHVYIQGGTTRRWSNGIVDCNMEYKLSPFEKDENGNVSQALVDDGSKIRKWGNKQLKVNEDLDDSIICIEQQTQSQMISAKSHRTTTFILNKDTPCSTPTMNKSLDWTQSSIETPNETPQQFNQSRRSLHEVDEKNGKEPKFNGKQNYNIESLDLTQSSTETQNETPQQSNQSWQSLNVVDEKNIKEPKFNGEQNHNIESLDLTQSSIETQNETPQQSNQSRRPLHKVDENKGNEPKHNEEQNHNIESLDLTQSSNESFGIPESTFDNTSSGNKIKSKYALYDIHTEQNILLPNEMEGKTNEVDLQNVSSYLFSGEKEKDKICLEGKKNKGLPTASKESNNFVAVKYNEKRNSHSVCYSKLQQQLHSGKEAVKESLEISSSSLFTPHDVSTTNGYESFDLTQTSTDEEASHVDGSDARLDDMNRESKVSTNLQGKKSHESNETHCNSISTTFLTDNQTIKDMDLNLKMTSFQSDQYLLDVNKTSVYTMRDRNRNLQHEKMNNIEIIELD